MQFKQMRKKPEKNISGLQWGLNLWPDNAGAML